MARFENAIKKITQVLNIISGVFLFLMMAVTVFNVLLRIPFNSMRGITELVSYSFVVVIFFSMGFTAITKSNVDVDILTSKFSKIARKITASIISLLSLIIWIVITWQNSVYSFGQWQLGEYSPVLDVKLWPVRLALVVGCIVFCIVLLIDLLKTIHGLVDNESNSNRGH